MTNAPPAGPLTPAGRSLRTWFSLAALGGLGVAVCAFLPWVTLRAPDYELTRTGIDAAGDGMITMFLGLVVDSLCLWAILGPRPPRGVGLSVLLIGFVILTVPAVDYSDFSRALAALDPTATSTTTAEIGLFGTAIGGALIMVGGWQARRAARRLARGG